MEDVMWQQSQRAFNDLKRSEREMGIGTTGDGGGGHETGDEDDGDGGGSHGGGGGGGMTGDGGGMAGGASHGGEAAATHADASAGGGADEDTVAGHGGAAEAAATTQADAPIGLRMQGDPQHGRMKHARQYEPVEWPATAWDFVEVCADQAYKAIERKRQRRLPHHRVYDTT